MDTSNRLTGRDNTEQESDKFEFAPDQKSLALKTRLAVGLLVAGAISLAKDVLTAGGVKAAPADPDGGLSQREQAGFTGGEDDLNPLSDEQAAPKNSARNSDADQTGPTVGRRAAPRDAARDDRADFEPSSDNSQVAMPPLQPIVPDAGNDNDWRLPPDFFYQDKFAPTAAGGGAASGGLAAKNDPDAPEPALVDNRILDPYDTGQAESDDSLVDSAGRPQARNRAPTVSGPVTLDGLLVNQAVLIGLSSLLAHAADADGDTLSVENLVASSGQLQARGDGSWIFTPDSDDTSEVVFNYTVSDGSEGVVQTALMDLLPLQHESPQEPLGTDGDDHIVGTAEGELIDARAGDDIVIAGGGDDTVLGGAGDDVIVGGDGDDLILGGAGNDTIFGDGGDDRIFGGAGDDLIWGGDGADILFGQTGNDILRGEAGSDFIQGGEGADTIDGGAGDDRVSGGEGADAVSGGSGDDVFLASMDDGDDSYDGGSGSDTYDLSETTTAATVDLAAGVASSAETGSDRLSGVENVVGSSDGDAIRGDSESNELAGGDGNDAIEGGGGGDSVSGGSGDDVFLASMDDGDDSYDGGSGSDTYDLSETTTAATVDLAAGVASSAETGSDRLSGVENVVGSSDGDVIRGDSESNDLAGGDGNDAIEGGGGGDSVSGGSGDDVFLASMDDGDDSYDGGSGSDTYDLSETATAATVDLAAGVASSAETGSDRLSGIENVKGGSGDDDIDGDDDDNKLEGGDGDDHLEGGDGDDHLEGGDGDDDISGGYFNDDVSEVHGSSQNDIVFGGDLSNRLEGHDGNDLIIGGSGNDVVRGGGDNDTFIATVDDGNDYYSGDDGIDTYSLVLTDAAATVDLKSGTASSAETGDDILHSVENVVGGSGDDTITADDEVNVLAGGGGQDTFVFESIADAGLGQGLRDRIVDFQPGDRIDLSQIDAHSGSEENDQFELLAARGDDLVVGKINYWYDFFDGQEYTIIQGNIDDDLEADFEIEVEGHHEFSIEDFNGIT